MSSSGGFGLTVDNSQPVTDILFQLLFAQLQHLCLVQLRQNNHFHLCIFGLRNLSKQFL